MDERINNLEFLRALLRSDFKSFAIKVFNEASAGAQYLDNWHVDVVCNEIEQMISGDNNRLIVNIPPRNMKSIICSVALPAYLLGLNPQTQIICVSYADELTKKFANDCRTVMETTWYADLFSCTKIDHRRSATMDFQTTRGGGRFSTTINGTLTGRGGDVDSIGRAEHVALRHIYKHLSLAYLNPEVVNHILSNQCHISVRDMLDKASRSNDFTEQKKLFDCICC